MRKITLLFTGLFFYSLSHAQATYSSTTMLAKTCQVWGYVKYFHSNVNDCTVNWDSVLVAHVANIKNAPDDAAFNAELNAMLDAAGEMEIPVTPPAEPASQWLHNIDFFWTADPVFDGQLKSALDTIRSRYRPELNCYFKLNDYTDPEDIGWLVFTNENNDIPSAGFPSEEYRLLILFRYWNIINYFHAYKNLMDIPWSISLETGIHECINATDELSWLKALRKQTAKTNDVHVTFSDLDFANLFFGGLSYPKFIFKRVEDQAVVTVSWLDGEELKPGDIIHAINGYTIDELTDSLRVFRPYCNDASFYRDVYLSMLVGALNSDMVIDAENETGNFTTTVIRNTTATDVFDHAYPTYAYDEYFLTDCGYGYVNMEKLTVGHINGMLNEFEDAPAIIFDLRNYPLSTAWALTNRIIDGSFQSALLNIPDLFYPGAWSSYPYEEFSGLSGNPEPYTGKIYMLCNEQTQSQAEYTIMKLQSFENHKVIGSQTAGADGNISTIRLPDSTVTNFTTLEVLYPDSSQTQRIGIRIDSIVTPTIEGLRNGVDEVLLAALDCITATKNEIKKETLEVYPNPASHVLQIVFDQQEAASAEIKLIGITGELFFTGTYNSNAIAIPVGDIPAGIYFVSVQFKDGISINREIIIMHDK